MKKFLLKTLKLISAVIVLLIILLVLTIFNAFHIKDNLEMVEKSYQEEITQCNSDSHTILLECFFGVFQKSIFEAQNYTTLIEINSLYIKEVFKITKNFKSQDKSTTLILSSIYLLKSNSQYHLFKVVDKALKQNDVLKKYPKLEIDYAILKKHFQPK